MSFDPEWPARVRRELDAGLDPLLTEAEAAARLGLVPKTLTCRRSSGGWPLPFVKLANGAVRYRWSALERFLAAGERGGE